jgi:hypothetical protein
VTVFKNLPYSILDFPDEETDPVDLLSFTTEENTIPETLGKNINLIIM